MEPNPAANSRERTGIEGTRKLQPLFLWGAEVQCFTVFFQFHFTLYNREAMPMLSTP